MTIKLGAVYNLTGGQSGLDIPSSQGARLAVEEANARGGVLGQPIELLLIDGETEPSVLAERTAALLVEHPTTSALFGLSDTDMVLAAAQVAALADRLFVTSGATSPQLPDQIPTYLFLACFGDNVQAAAAAEYATNAMAARTALVVYRREDTFTELLQAYFVTRFTELGGRILHQASYTTLDEMVEALAGAPAADLVFFSGAPDDAIEGVARLRSLGIDSPIMGGDSFDLGTMWATQGATNDTLSGVIFTTHAFVDLTCPDPAMAVFIQDYVQAYPGQEPGAFAVLGYDTVRLLLSAIEQAGSAEPAAVLDALARIQAFQGLAGTIRYESGSRVPTKSITLLQVERGQVTLAGTCTPTQTPQP